MARNSTLATVLSLAALGLCSSTLAGPQNPNVTHGSATFSQNGNFWLIQASNGAVIAYSSFDIHGHQTVQFLQPGSDAKVLNQINSGMPTNIDGTLLANGIVYFANPAGMVFGNGATINVGGIYAAAANIDGDDFHAFATNPSVNTLSITGVSGDVINHATIQARHVAHLIGKHVENHGLISVYGQNGILAMTAQSGDVIVTEPGSNYMVTLVNPADGPGSITGQPGVLNTGTLVAMASGGQIKLGAGDMFSMAIALNGQGVVAGETVNLEGDVLLSDEVVIYADTVSFHGTVDAEVEGQDSLWINSARDLAGNALFLDEVGGNSALQSLEVAGTTQIHGGLVATTEHQAYHGAVTLEDHALLQGSLIHFHDTLDTGLTLQAGDFYSLDILGNVIFDGEVGGNKALLSLGVTGTSQINGGLVNTIDGQTYEGAVTLGQDTVLVGSLIDFHDTLDLGTLQQAGDGHLSIFGDAVFGGEVGGIEELKSLYVDGTSAINGSLVQTFGDQTYNGNVTIGGGAAATELISTDNGLIAFNAALDAGAAPQASDTWDLEIHANAEFGGMVGNAKALSSLLVTGESAINGGLVQTTGDQTYLGAAGIGQDALLQSDDGSVRFGSTLSGERLWIEAGLDAIFGGNVSLRRLEVDAGQDIRFETESNAALLIQILEDLSLRADRDIRFQGAGNGVIAIDVGEDLTFTAGNVIEFAGNPSTLQSLTISAENLALDAGTLIDFNAENTAVTATGGLILLNTDTGAAIAVPVASTIGAGGNLTFTGGTFKMGQNHKMTVLGTLEIDMTDTATLSDINTLGNLVVNASTIELLLRDGGSVLLPAGASLSDAGLDFVAGGQIFFTYDEIVLLQNGQPVANGYVAFGSTHPDGPDGAGTLQQFLLLIMTDLGEMRVAETYFDLKAEGIATTDASTIFAADVPRDEEREEVSDDVLAEAIGQLQELGLRVRQPRADELAELVAGRGLYIDRAPTAAAAGLAPYEIVVLRLSSRVIPTVLETFQSLREDAQTGETIVGERQASLSRAWERFTEAVTDSPSAAAFVEALTAADDADSALALDSLRTFGRLVEALQRLGLTRGEIEDALQASIYPLVIPQEMQGRGWDAIDAAE